MSSNPSARGLALQAACVRNANCAHGFCKDGQCSTPTAVDDPCSPSHHPSEETCASELTCSALSHTCIPKNRAAHKPCVHISDCHWSERCVLGVCKKELGEGEQCTPVERSMGMKDDCADGFLCSGSTQKSGGQTHCLALCMLKSASAAASASKTVVFGCPGNQECFPLPSKTAAPALHVFGICGFRSTKGNIYPYRSAAWTENIGVLGIVGVSVVAALVAAGMAILGVRWRNRRRLDAERKKPSFDSAAAVAATAFAAKYNASSSSLSNSSDIELHRTSQKMNEKYPSLSADLIEEDGYSEEERGQGRPSTSSDRRPAVPPPPSYTESNSAAATGAQQGGGGHKKSRSNRKK